MTTSDPYLDSLRRARDSRAVIKTELAVFISGCDETVKIFAFEGADDRKVYYHWIKLIGLGIRYEPFTCKNKLWALKLLDVLTEDATNLGERVFVFVDRDFDDLQGRVRTARTYLTDGYSIESHLVCNDVVADLLMIDFQCNGDHRLRAEVLTLFGEKYSEFLRCTRELNFRIFLARRLQIKQIGDLPNRLDSIASIELDTVRPIPTDVRNLVILEREPSEEEVASLIDEFNQLVPQERYRGKFSWMFLTKWLGLLASDRRAEKPRIFCRAKRPDGAVPSGFSLEAIAAKSKAPESLRHFLSTAVGPTAA